jgi:thiazole synthase ThiGH ThiG subunit
MVEKGETKYDKIIEQIRTLAGGSSSNEAIANVALAQTVFNNEMTDKLLAVLVNKKILTPEEVEELEADAQNAYKTGMIAIARKNPDIIKKI